ncbi:MAG: ATP-binding protein, partial [Candidatus Omnitrophota bacterium]
LSLLSERKDEMGTLARTIIHMAQRIGNYQEDLERQINERTAQLTVAKDKAEAVAIQLQKTQKQLVQSEKMAGIGQLSAGIAHEINNPAGFVLTNLNCLEKNIETLFQSMEDVIRLIAEYFPHSDNTGEFYESLKRITETRKIQFIKKDMPDLISQTIEGAQRIKKIVGNLKNFSHPGEKEKRPINVNVEIDKALDLINNEIKYNCEVIKDLKEVPLILANPQQLEQVFINIIINAGQAIYKKGIIRISTYLKDPVVIIEISDNGKGISEDAISQIFNPFFTTKDVGKGTGLGLSIVYGIIKDHNGQINVYSKIGEGTRVVISLPVMDK